MVTSYKSAADASLRMAKGCCEARPTPVGCADTPEQPIKAFFMRLRWLLTGAACLLLAGVASAQPEKKPPMTSPAEPRAALPPSAPATKNYLKSRGDQRGYAEADAELRQSFDNNFRLLSQPEKTGRDYFMFYEHQKELKRAVIEPALFRNRGLLAQHPDDKVIKLNEAALGRSFVVPPSRSAPPAMRYAPNDRQGADKR
jgi:hypothetical protein